MKYDIFVSYRRSDRELVASVVRRLEKRGVGVWYDADIEGGADWRDTIVESLTNSDMLVIFFSDDCNNSRQLKKELAVADHLGKPVVPILIENTQPRGAYLYELADRNWIQIWPEPMDRIDELVEHLTTLAGKSEGGLSGAAEPKPEALKKSKVSPPAANDGIPVPAANDDLARDAEQPLAEAVEEFINTDSGSRPAPKIAKAYVGSASRPGKPIKKLNDILPFKWLDLIVLVPMIAFFAMVVLRYPHEQTAATAAFLGIAAFGALAFFGSLVFPVRYYLRRRSIGQAIGAYVVSSLILFVLFGGALMAAVALEPASFATGSETGGQLGPNPSTAALVAVFYWVITAAIAFLVYGVLAGQRAIRSFRSNIRKL